MLLDTHYSISPNTVTNVDYRSTAGDQQHHSVSSGRKLKLDEGGKNETEGLAVSTVALANERDWAAGQGEDKDLLTVCSCTHDCYIHSTSQFTLSFPKMLSSGVLHAYA